MKSKKIAFLMNSSILGGAERSMVLQTSFLDEKIEKTFFIPVINNNMKSTEKLVTLIKQSGEVDIRYYDFPKSLFSISRSGKGSNLIFVLLSFLKISFTYKKLKIDDFDIIWANGNKVGLSAFIFSKIFNFKNKFIWHFRDYPERSRKFRLIWRFLKKKNKFDLTLIGNSLSVSDDLKQVTSNQVSVESIYNPVSELKRRFPVFMNNELCIGIVGMLAPWKGIHEIILWSSLFEKELMDLNICSIRVYGDEIYQTAGEHTGYKQELVDLKSKLNAKLIDFCGLEDPSEIFDKIDIMIHSSLRREPFGRVITESFSAGVPVISTGIGGAGELVEHMSTGQIYSPGDYQGLFDCVKKYIEDENFRNEIIQNAILKRKSIEEQIKSELAKIV